MDNAATRILLVEDNPGDAELIRESLAELRSGEFELDCVGRLSEALEELEGERPIDVVLLDLSLPDSSGLGTLAALKQHAPSVPVVVMTGLDDESLALTALRSGAQDYLVKGKADAQLIRRSLLYAIERRQGEVARVRLAEEQAARAAAERAHERSALLADASIVLTSSFDYARTLASLTALPVPGFADMSALVLYGQEGGLELVLVEHVDKTKAELLEQLCRGALEQPEMPCVADVVRHKRSLLVPDITDSWLIENLRAPEVLALALPLGPKSAVVVPLQIRGQLLGAFALVFAGGRRYGRDDLAMLEDLARRAELAVDNARLYDEAQSAIGEARESLRVRDEFMAVAAHELRTPLTPLILRLAALKKVFADAGVDDVTGRVGGKLSQTIKAADRLSKLVENLLDFSRLNSGRLSLVREDVDACELVRDVASRFSDEAARAGSEVTVYAEGRVTGKWDRLRIDQVITNLLSNAIKYGAGRPIDVTVVSDGAMAWITVQDRGIGIAEDARSSIFGRFERAVSNHHYGGLGLGLYITRQIVAAHDGSVDVVSKVGAGSIFTVKLPRHLPSEQSGIRPPPAEHASS